MDELEPKTDGCKAIKIALFASTFGLIATVIALIVVVAIPPNGKMSFKAAKRYAGELVNSELYAQAVEEYERMLREYRIGDKEAGALLYQIGDISAEKLHDPRKALAAYIKLKELFPKHPLIAEVDRKIITQFDKMGNPRSAQRLLEKTVSLGKPASEIEASKIVAKIGERAISSDEVEAAMRDLPPSMARQFSEPAARAEFLKGYVGQQLIYDAALREGYDSRPEVVAEFDKAHKAVISNFYYKEKVMNRVTITPSDIEMFYEAHKAELGGKPLDEVRSEVREALQQQKMAQLQSELLDKLIATEKVQLYPENLKPIQGL